MLASPWSLEVLWFHFSLGHQTKICFKMFHSGICSPSGIWQSFRRNYFKFSTETFPTLNKLKTAGTTKDKERCGLCVMRESDWGDHRETQIYRMVYYLRLIVGPMSAFSSESMFVCKPESYTTNTSFISNDDRRDQSDTENRNSCKERETALNLCYKTIDR